MCIRVYSKNPPSYSCPSYPLLQNQCSQFLRYSTDILGTYKQIYFYIILYIKRDILHLAFIIFIMNSFKLWITNSWQILFHLYPYQLSIPYSGPQDWGSGEASKVPGHNLRKCSLSGLYLYMQVWLLKFYSLGLPHLRSSSAGSTKLFWS